MSHHNRVVEGRAYAKSSMNRKAALAQPAARTGSLWREKATGIVWQVTGRSKERYRIVRVGSGATHGMYHQNLMMFYDPYQPRS